MVLHSCMIASFILWLLVWSFPDHQQQFQVNIREKGKRSANSRPFHHLFPLLLWTTCSWSWDAAMEMWQKEELVSPGALHISWSPWSVKAVSSYKCSQILQQVSGVGVVNKYIGDLHLLAFSSKSCEHHRWSYFFQMVPVPVYLTKESSRSLVTEVF